MSWKDVVRITDYSFNRKFKYCSTLWLSTKPALSQSSAELTPSNNGSSHQEMIRFWIEHPHYVCIQILSFNSHPHKTCESEILQHQSNEDTSAAILGLVSSNEKYKVKEEQCQAELDKNLTCCCFWTSSTAKTSGKRCLFSRIIRWPNVPSSKLH